ncbi:hypothetical protein MKK68_03545 [Methylobacterium sp. E-016]|uniref:hypothetical protein n=1 Tax=Methylobacterium sp. E-016 TaxID=2836556 RepID=UPI001FB8A53E|nr:hypothetical protein [Methylobacterium sp. E-016]MCJ2074728.1 hypothetical protein [Methylobacterium sp. E-016]
MTLIISTQVAMSALNLIEFHDAHKLSVAKAEFWKGVPALVTSKVQLAQVLDAKGRSAVIEYLRDLEAVARSECDCRGTVQVIASGRRLLGDKTEMAPGNGPFSRT